MPSAPAVSYSSTRGGVNGLNFMDAVVSGLAADGGLLVPDWTPTVAEDEQREWRTLSYRDLCFRVMRKFITKEEISDDALQSIIQRAYQQFRKSECVEIKQLNVATDNVSDQLNKQQPNVSSHIYLMELFHGPTFAFKDFALQFLGQLFDHILKSTGQRMVMLGATSGDTGSAAVAGFSGIDNVKCLILYPEGKTSRIQELQMTTVMDPNVTCLALEGSCFDDCQNIVKEILSSPLKTQLNLSSVNSINWARILAQVVYYWFACFKVQELEKQRSNETSTSTKDCSDCDASRGLVDVCVPTGNFGNILAAYYAKQMGAPVGRLIIASNSNDILTRFFSSGKYQVRSVVPTSSPSMDIQISSNFERFFFYLVARDSNLVEDNFGNLLKTKNEFEVDSSMLKKISLNFSAYSANEVQTAEITKAVFNATKDVDPIVLDPHTAVGVHCALEYRKEFKSASPLIIASTAHCGKFPETLEKILGHEAVEKFIPKELAELENKPRKVKAVPATLDAVQSCLIDFCS